MKMSPGIVLLLVLAQGMAGCSGRDSSPMPPGPSPVQQPPPTPVPPPRPPELAVFTDSATGVSSSDVHDVQEQVVRFEADELIWVADGARFPEFIVDGNFIGYHHKADRLMQVRFGTKDGERRAYLTWPDDRLNGLAPAILDLLVDERGELKIVETMVPVPGV